MAVTLQVDQAFQDHRGRVPDALRALCDQGCPIRAVADVLVDHGYDAKVGDFLGIPQIEVEGHKICWVQSQGFQRSSFGSTSSFSMSDSNFDLEREASELRGYADPYGW